MPENNPVRADTMQPDLISALGRILEPLPSLEELSASSRGKPSAQTLDDSEEAHKLLEVSEEANHVSGTNTRVQSKRKSRPPTSQPVKRPRTGTAHGLDRIRLEISKSAQALRRDGIVPRTLFFPSLPQILRKDVELRAAIGIGLEDLKTLQMQGKKMAWATFASEAECLDSFLSLREAHPSLKVSLHRPKQTQADRGDMSAKNSRVFEDRAKGVIAKGGLGNTLLFRNLPVEVDCGELEKIINALLESVSPACNPLRVRTALSKSKGSRNFWTVHADIDASKRAFSHLFLKVVTFRCGKTAKLNPIVHDDASDVDSKKRRERAVALGTQESDMQREGVAPVATRKNSIGLLEDYLRATQNTFVFLSD